MIDSLTAFGIVRVLKRHKDTGIVLMDTTFKNQITNFARQQSAQMWSGLVNTVGIASNVLPPSKIQLGTGSPTAPATGTTANDTGLWTPLGSSKALDTSTVWMQYYSQFTVTFLSTEDIGTVDPVNNPTGQITITEAGLFDANNQLWSHVAFTGVTHDNTSTLSVQWQVLMQGN